MTHDGTIRIKTKIKMKGGDRVEEKSNNTYIEEKELLHEQMKLLAEQSKGCQPHELAELSEQMVAIYSVLHN